MDKIKNISITNFKSIKQLEVNNCNRINVFIGMPNAGKSNILEALGLFGLFDNINKSYKLSDFVRFNNPEQLFYEENILKKIFISTNIQKINISLDNKMLNFYYKDEIYDKPRHLDFFFGNGDKKPVGNKLNPYEEFNCIRKYIFNIDTNNRKSNWFNENLEFPFGENIAQVLSTNSSLRNDINNLFKLNNLKLLIEKKTNELNVFKEYEDGTFFTLPYNLIADTLQRLIFYKAAIMSNENSVLLFEEPEAHCFEPYILEFTNAIKYDENNNQYFIVTHSDFIIQEFLRDEESKNNTNIYLVNNVDGETKVKLLDKEKNEEVYEFGMNAFFNFETLWETN